MSSSGVTLLPASAYYPWSLEGVNYASCAKPRYPTDNEAFPAPAHEAPHEDCECGFWAYRSYEQMAEYGPQCDIHGVVALGGDMEEHRMGVRAAEARIVALLDDEHGNARYFKERYEQGVPPPTRTINILSEERANIGFVVGRPETDGIPGRPFPLPILSAAECELLAYDEGCVFEPEAPPLEPPPVTEVGQYLVRAGGYAYRNPFDQPYETGYGFVFAPPDEAPLGAMRVDEYIASAASSGQATHDFLFYDQIARLYLGRVYNANFGDLMFWHLGTLMERDEAMMKAIKKYGHGWMARYAVEHGG